MRLVDQHGRAPIGVLHGGEEKGAAVEVVVVVAHDHVGPARHLLRQEIRAHGVRQRDVPERRPVEPHRPGGLFPRRGQPVVETFCERARIAVAGPVGVFANLLARREFEHACLCAFLAEHAQRIQRHSAAGSLGGQEEDLVDLLRGARLQQRKDGGQRLADAGGRLRHQAASVHARAVDGLGKFPLAGPKRAMGKLEPAKRVAEHGVVLGFALRPGAVAGAQAFEVVLQRSPVVRLFQHGFLAGGEVEVHQRHRDALVPVQLAQHPAIGAGLGPVQRPVVAADGIEVAAEGLDFLDAGFARIVAVGTAAHLERAVVGNEGHLALVGVAPPALHERVAGHALERAGRGHETQIEVACLGTEGAQSLDGDRARIRQRIRQRIGHVVLQLCRKVRGHLAHCMKQQYSADCSAASAHRKRLGAFSDTKDLGLRQN
ncbi:hypothetical protein QFZ42_002304 [Variovorax paradoxus]|nr:hypothetical protein [Variovorax paradoxus]